MTDLAVGDEVEVRLGKLVHGGHCLAHIADATVFVRHGLPGELVTARITERTSKAIRADVIAVAEAAPERVVPPCAWARPGGCGGCDLAHASVDFQRTAKSAVLRESLARFAKIDDARLDALDLTVRELPGHPDGLGWRTRIRYSQCADGSWGLLGWHSHDVHPVGHCPLGIGAACNPGPSETTFMATVRDRSWRVRPDMFWQAHEGLPEALVDSVMRLARPVPGERWWDLYSGAGLFAAFLGEAVGSDGTVDAVEVAVPAVKGARRALHDLPQVRIHGEDVGSWVRAAPAHADGIVLDPPRKGAGAALVSAVAAAGPHSVVYVACDPVSLARDAAHFADAGYRLDAIEAFDAFPMSHHFETVALFTPAGSARRG